MESQIITYDPRFKKAFADLNREWIEKYFKIEKKDVEQLSEPEACLAEGGEIFFVVEDGEAVGTCAMYKVGERRYELAKMAVRPDQQGKGLGERLMIAAEAWAKSRGAAEILILSNTVLSPAISLYKKRGFETIRLGPHPDYERADIEMLKKL